MLAKPVQLNKLGQLANVGAALDPRDMLRQLREKASAVPALAADGLREQIVQSFGTENIEEAREVIEEASDPGTKAVMLCQLCQSVTDRAQKRPLLADALVQARASRNPKFHVVGLALVRHTIAGFRGKRARDGRSQGGPGRRGTAASVRHRVRGPRRLAVCLARVDVPAAIGLFKGVKANPQTFAHRCGELRHVVAGIEPAQAENILKMLPEWAGPEKFSWRDLFVPRVCCRMAGRDLPRARRLADGLDSAVSRGWAYGAMADTLAATDRQAATECFAAASPCSMRRSLKSRTPYSPPRRWPASS